MVQEMKLSFTSAMEELAKTQYGDDSLHQQLSADRESNLRQITELTDLVKSLKVRYILIVIIPFVHPCNGYCSIVKQSTCYAEV